MTVVSLFPAFRHSIQLTAALTLLNFEHATRSQSRARARARTHTHTHTHTHTQSRNKAPFRISYWRDALSLQVSCLKPLVHHSILTFFQLFQMDQAVFSSLVVILLQKRISHSRDRTVIVSETDAPSVDVLYWSQGGSFLAHRLIRWHLSSQMTAKPFLI
jgi:hypothetical protein